MEERSNKRQKVREADDDDDDEPIVTEGHLIFCNYLICTLLLRYCNAERYFLLRRVNRMLYDISKTVARCEAYFQVVEEAKCYLSNQLRQYRFAFLPNRITYIVPSGECARRVWMDSMHGLPRLHMVSRGGVAWCERDGELLWKVPADFLKTIRQQPAGVYENLEPEEKLAYHDLQTFHNVIGQCYVGDLKLPAALAPDWEQIVVPPSLNLKIDWQTLPGVGFRQWEGVASISLELMDKMRSFGYDEPLVLEDEQRYSIEQYLEIYLCRGGWLYDVVEKIKSGRSKSYPGFVVGENGGH